MLPEIIKQNFEEIALLYIGDELSEAEKFYWQNKMKEYPQLQLIAEEYTKLYSITNNFPEVTIDSRKVENMLSNIPGKSGARWLEKLGSFLPEFQISPVFRFAVVLFFFIAGVAIIRFSSPAQPEINTDLLLDWEGTAFNERVINLDQKLEEAREFNVGLAGEKTWNEKIKNFNERLKLSTDDQIFSIDQNFIKSISE